MLWHIFSLIHTVACTQISSLSKYFLMPPKNAVKSDRGSAVMVRSEPATVDPTPDTQNPTEWESTKQTDLSLSLSTGSVSMYIKVRV